MWDSVHNYDPDTGVHRGYDASAMRPWHRPVDVPDPAPPVKLWDELSQVERHRGYDIYGRPVRPPEEE